MPRTGRAIDFLEDYHLTKDRVRRLEMRQRGAMGQVESFIMDPVVVRSWPPALAADMRLTGVMVWIESGSVDVSFNATIEGATTVLHTFSGISAGVVHSAISTDMDYGNEMNLEIGDWYYPTILSGFGANIVAAFITNPG